MTCKEKHCWQSASGSIAGWQIESMIDERIEVQLNGLGVVV
jgi:hypothetical protein